MRPEGDRIGKKEVHRRVHHGARRGRRPQPNDMVFWRPSSRVRNSHGVYSSTSTTGGVQRHEQLGTDLRKPPTYPVSLACGRMAAVG
jgi:hypothetical protein